ncbi:MAG: hypothetical protein J6Q51_00385, partial [Clostridia bacterium]|nr:hypothetical protein [Clostridia bacterium]
NKIINFYVGTQNKSQYLIKDDINCFYESLYKFLNYKVKISNKKLEYLFNVYLPKQIESCELDTKQKIEIKDINEVYKLYKQKHITAINFYLWLKEVYFGIKETNVGILIKPIYTGEFCLLYKHKLRDIVISIKNLCLDNKYMEIDGVKYKNYFLIPKNKLDIINKVMLVI